MRIRLPNFPKHNEYAYYFYHILAFCIDLTFWRSIANLFSFHFKDKEREKTGKL